MNTLQIETIGGFLSTYRSDLEYIRNFQLFISGKIPKEKYLEREVGHFYDFLVTYKIVRGIKKNESGSLLELTETWIREMDSRSVEGFAIYLNESGIVHGNKILVSMCSKILFLNNPWTVFPYDSRAKKTLKTKTKSYHDYRVLVSTYEVSNREIIDFCLGSISQHCATIEESFEEELKGIRTIRKNRFIDKLLWTLGKPERK